MTGDSMVYSFDSEVHVQAPVDYSPGWRHVESSDPALQSKFGFTLWAESPINGKWYCVKAEYIEGVFAPEDILDVVLKKTEGYNIVRRIADPHEAWYINTAAKRGIKYVSPYDKNSRKAELIKNTQAALGNTILIAPWCSDLKNEFAICQWSEKAEAKIVNSSKFHLLDSTQYFVDCKPTPTKIYENKTWHQELREGNQVRKKQEALQIKLRVKNRKFWNPATGKRIT